MNLSNMATNLTLMLRFAHRDYCFYRNRMSRYLVNYALIYPALHAFAYGYLQSQIYFDQDTSQMGTILFTGNFLLVIILLAFKLNIELLEDLEADRAIDYQITILQPQLILIERILFATVFCFITLLPYFPVAKLLLGTFFATANISWLNFLGVLFASCLMASAIILLAAVALPNTDKIGLFWRRVNIPLFTIGGFWIPWYVINRFSPALATVALLNPFLYITEGIRQSILGQPEFLPAHVCIIALLIFTLIFTAATCYLFKKRVDHI